MLKTELLNNDTLIKTYSDSGMMIKQEETGILYAEAIDPVSANRIYTETNTPIDGDEDIPAEEALDIIFGGTL